MNLWDSIKERFLDPLSNCQIAGKVLLHGVTSTEVAKKAAPLIDALPLSLCSLRSTLPSHFVPSCQPATLLTFAIDKRCGLVNVDQKRLKRNIVLRTGGEASSFVICISHL
jgi:hypothetical protein